MNTRFVVVLSLLLQSVVAQGDPKEVAERYRNAGRALQNSTAEVADLIELRMRHDLGLVTELEDSVVRVEEPTTPRLMSRQGRALEKIKQENDFFRGQYEKLRAKVKLLNDAAQATSEGEDVGQAIPAIGSSLPGPRGRQPGTGTSPRAMPAAPGVETKPSRVGREDLGSLALDPLKAQIHGSKDHMRVAQALFKVGQALMDRGAELRGQGRSDVARELDFRAKARLDRAIKELEPLSSKKDPDYVVLFYLGRCRELLFRFSERHEGLSLESDAGEYSRRRQLVREPFLKITARDVKKSGAAGTVEVLGSWGQAAKTAVEHFRWMNTNASFDALQRIEALTWPGEDRQ